MYIKPHHGLQGYPQNPSNPTNEQRHEMLRQALIKEGRPEDYDNILYVLSPPSDIAQYVEPGKFKGLKVGIVGGGLAGMSAAFELRRLGYDITIFEPQTERIGGRVYTYYFDNDKRLYGELGAMRIPASHETTWHYINLFKLDTRPIILSNSNAFIYVRDVRTRTDPKGENVVRCIYPKFNLTANEAKTPWPELYDQVTRYYLSIMPPEVRKQFLMIISKYDYRQEAIQNMTIYQALERYGLSAEAINLITGIIPSVGGLINNSFEAELHGEYTIDYQNTYYIAGGMTNLPLAFYKSLTSPNPSEYPGIPQDALGKVTWKGGFAINGILRSGNNGKVTLRYRRVAVLEDIYEDFDYVICAIPFSVLREHDIYPAFSPAKMQAIKEVYYQDAQKTLFLCRERFWEKQGIFRGASYTDEVIGMISYPQDHSFCTQESPECSPNEPGVLLASYNMGNDAFSLGGFEPIGRYNVIRSKVEKVHGLPRWYLDKNKIVIDYKTVDWSREKWFSGAFSFYLIGQKNKYNYISTIPEYDNRVFFAGEHISVKNGWMQGALWSGMKAAQDVAYSSSIHKYPKY